MGFFHCKIDPGEKKLTPKSFNRKLQKKIPPSVANWEADTKPRQDEQKWSDFVQKE